MPRRRASPTRSRAGGVHPRLPRFRYRYRRRSATRGRTGYGGAHAQSEGKIAILVRSRAPLARIAQRLKQAGHAFRAVEIEPLAERPVVQDLLALTRALTHLADRAAWLALLRAPWCGLTLADLVTIAGDEHAAKESPNKSFSLRETSHGWAR